MDYVFINIRFGLAIFSFILSNISLIISNAKIIAILNYKNK